METGVEVSHEVPLEAVACQVVVHAKQEVELLGVAHQDDVPQEEACLLGAYLLVAYLLEAYLLEAYLLEAYPVAACEDQAVVAAFLVSQEAYSIEVVIAFALELAAS